MVMKLDYYTDLPKITIQFVVEDNRIGRFRVAGLELLKRL